MENGGGAPRGTNFVAKTVLDFEETVVTRFSRQVTGARLLWSEPVTAEPATADKHRNTNYKTFLLSLLGLPLLLETSLLPF